MDHKQYADFSHSCAVAACWETVSRVCVMEVLFCAFLLLDRCVVELGFPRVIGH